MLPHCVPMGVGEGGRSFGEEPSGFVEVGWSGEERGGELSVATNV